jgi:hypothetical protein
MSDLPQRRRLQCECLGLQSRRGLIGAVRAYRTYRGTAAEWPAIMGSAGTMTNNFRRRSNIRKERRA